MQDVTFDTYEDEIKEKEFTFIEKYRGKLKSQLDIFLDSLDEYQKDIVLNKDINLPLKVMSGAGSGKTRCLLAKALKMILQDGVDPSSIVLITFTNKAANEIKERYLKFFRDHLDSSEMLEIPPIHISTIHSFSYSVLYKLFGIRRTILNESHTISLLKSILMDVLGMKKIEMKLVKAVYEALGKIYSKNEIHYFGMPEFTGGGVFKRMMNTKEVILNNPSFYNLIDSFSDSELKYRIFKSEKELREDIIMRYANSVGLSSSSLLGVVNAFLHKKYISNTVDFSDMQYLVFYLLNQHKALLQDVWARYKYFIVDESQDIDNLEFSLMVTCDQDSYRRYIK